MNERRRALSRPSGSLAVVCVLAILVTGVIGGCSSDRAVRSNGDAPRQAVVLKDEYSFWPPAPDEPRIQFLRSFSLSSDVERDPSTLDRMIFGNDRQVLPIAKPYGVAHHNDRIYVCDITNPSVVILDLDRRQTRLMITRGVEQMAQPTDIAIGADGMKYVADRRLGRIFVFDASDRHVMTFGVKGLVPVGVAVYQDELYVADFATQSVVVLDANRGTPVRSIGGPGSEAGQFVRPLGVEVDTGGRIYVSDAIRGRVQVFDHDGTFRTSIGELGDTPGSFVRPKHMGIIDQGVLFVVDAAFQNVQMFDDSGTLLMYFGSTGPFVGSMSLPAGIVVTRDGLGPFAGDIHPAFNATHLILVTNQFGTNKISAYAMGTLHEGRTIADITGAPDFRPVPPDAIGGDPAAPGGGANSS